MRTGKLRNVQVQLRSMEQLSDTASFGNFTRKLQRGEQREVRKLTKRLKPAKERRVAKSLKVVRSELKRIRKESTDEWVQEAVDEVIRQRGNDFLQSRLQFNPEDQQTLHSMRIALRKLRYVIEATQPPAGSRNADRLTTMQSLQGLLGDVRDVELLQNRMRKWATKKGRLLAIAPAMNQLDGSRIQLMAQLRDSAPIMNMIVPGQRLLPLGEKTTAGPATAINNPQPESYGARSSHADAFQEKP
jgi:CHAD domain-containing protein